MKRPDKFSAWKLAAILPTLLAALAFQASVWQSEAQFVLTDGNSTAIVDPTSQAGMFHWDVQGQNQLQQQWFWYSAPTLGIVAPQSIDTISPALATPFNGTRGLATTYANPAFSVTINYLLTGGAVVPVGQYGNSDIGETIRISNNTGAVLPFTFYQYSHFNLEGQGNDTVQLGTNLRGQFNDAFQTDGAVGLTETVTTPGASHGEVAPFGQTLGELNNGVNPVQLDDNGGPVGPGQVTWALEWDFLIAPGSTALISKDKYLSVLIQPIPEPGSVALLALGVAGLVWKRRQAAK